MGEHKLKRQPLVAGAGNTVKQIRQANATRSTSNKQTPDTMGVIADLHTAEGRTLVDGVIKETGDKYFEQIVELAHGLGKRYVVAAGRFNNKGLVCCTSNEVESLRATFQMANSRMNEAGSRTTQWLIMPVSLGTMINREGVMS
jgi:hypothetical protein